MILPRDHATAFELEGRVEEQGVKIVFGPDIPEFREKKAEKAA